jgi:hypothetical protein
MKTFYHRLDLTCDEHGSTCGPEAVHVGNSQLLLALFRKWTPVISQTQAFDTVTVLGSAAADSEDGSYFRSLVHDRRIRFSLYKTNSIREAFIQKLENPNYVFASWPELNSGELDAKQVIEAIREPKSKTLLPDQVRWQVETLHALDDALSEDRSSVIMAQSPRESLHQLLKRTAAKAAEMKLASASALANMERQNSNEWSVCFTALIGMDCTLDVQREALAILNICYDSVLADSLRAGTSGILTESATAARLMKAILPGAKTGSMYGPSSSIAFQDPLKSAEIQDIQQVGWKEVKTFLDEHEDLQEDQLIRYASAASLIANVATDDGGRLGVWPSRANYAYKMALLKAGPVITQKIEEMLPVVGGAAGWIVAGLAAYQPGKHVRQLLNWRLQRKYYALLCSERHASARAASASQ